jgi:hypothetical protein
LRNMGRFSRETCSTVARVGSCSIQSSTFTRTLRYYYPTTLENARLHCQPSPLGSCSRAARISHKPRLYNFRT